MTNRRKRGPASGWLALLGAWCLAGAILTSPAQAAEPSAAVARVAAIGDIGLGEKTILFNSLLSQLSQSYQLVPQEDYTAAEERAFQELEVEQCTEEACIRRIREYLQVDRLFALQIVREGNFAQVSLKLVRSGDIIVRAGTCPSCGIAELEATVSRLAAAVAAADAGGAPAVAVPAPTPAQAAITTPQSGSVWWEPITGMEFLYIPGGEYPQGCGYWAGEECNDDEKPTRPVRLSAFWLGKIEVTQDQWKRIMGANPSKFQGDHHPVEAVSWDDVQQFIRKLNAQSGGATFRLPTEAEWEYACRGGGKPVNYGTQTGELSHGLANYGSRGTVQVGSFAPNPLGLHDMSGNVAEWTQDVFNNKAYGSGPASDPTYSSSSGYRVVRGGGYTSIPRLLRCSRRGQLMPSLNSDDLGFRLVRTK